MRSPGENFLSARALGYLVLKYLLNKLIFFVKVHCKFNVDFVATGCNWAVELEKQNGYRMGRG